MVARYRQYGPWLRRRYGARVRKLGVDAGFTCPTRDGAKGSAGCSYCLPESYSAAARAAAPPLAEQVARGMAAARRRDPATRFIIYFQPFSNTYADVATLRERFDVIRRFDGVVGLAVGTRPDCVPDEVLDLLAEYAGGYDVGLELGLPSAHDATLARVGRGHTVAQFADAVRRAAERKLPVCAHLILGLPGEGRGELLATADFVAGLPIQAVKLHNLIVTRGTELETRWRAGDYRPLTREEYVSLAADLLERLPTEVVIQRLAAETPAEWLVAPAWARDKHGVVVDLGRELERRDTRQGARYRGGAAR